METNLKTRREDFYKFSDSPGSEMFEIKEGLPAVEALEFASNLLGSCNGLLRDGNHREGLSQASKYCLQCLLPQVKAAVDSVWNGLELGVERKEA